MPAPQQVTADKALSAPLTIKAGASDGSVEALFSVYNTIDSMGDVVLPGAFVDGQEVAMASWSHDWGKFAVGKGTIHSTPQGAIFRGQFFLDTELGLETYKTVKNMGSLQEWSFGFSILDSEMGKFGDQPVRYLKSLETYEVSPVLIGANRHTQTIAIKSDEQLPPEDPATSDPVDESSDHDSTERFADQFERVLLDVSALATRAADISDLRAKSGRQLSEANRRRLQGLVEQLTELLTATEPAPPTEEEDPAKATREEELARSFARLDSLVAIYAPPPGFHVPAYTP